MEIAISLACALAGMVLALMFLLDLISMVGSGVVERKRLVICLVKLLAGLLLLHFHFEMDILD
ncbi:hypothetical protein [Desulfallas thermosapovorans]|uniref:Uncharacterized protein n=1 Tax=Desulfallas thermosapovorans DSM 6562 TaxID=1121431 RepID=A0A5S4ZSI7_9FIRM|nr:hypothetical protein [Desulfallas thermosapovorans]TYO95906.1 hypothetical protein LX24_01296 [Desulfallas thermosapovorans DSM 6562]